MRMSSGSCQTVSNSIRQHLNRFAIATIVAVGLLVLPAAAKIVYTPVNVTVSGNGSIRIDLNHDGADFTVDVAAGSEGCGFFGEEVFAFVNVTPAMGNGVVARGEDAAALNIGTQIDSSESFYEAQAVMASGIYESGPPPCPAKHTSGYWCNGKTGRTGDSPCHTVDGYLGLEFEMNGSTHYGWAHLAITPRSNLTFAVKLTGYAYETVAGMPINAGQT